MTSRARRASTLIVLAAVLPPVSAACSRQGDGGAAAAGSSSAATTAGSGTPAATTSTTSTSDAASASAAPVTVTMRPADGERKVRPDAPVAVTASSGTVSSVVVTDDKGTQVPGAMTGGTWKPTRPLALGSRYTVKAGVQLSDGRTQSATSTFSTLEPAAVTKYALTPMEDRVGVGMPAIVSFNSDIPKDKRAEVERHMQVVTTPAVDGAWGWTGDRQVMWRPQAYWKPGTKVSVKTDLEGVEVGDGRWITRNDQEDFTIGRSQVTKVDMNTHHMTVFRDGKPVKTIPVTTGKSGFVTRSGTKVIMEKVGHMTMDSETVGIPKGDPNYYKLDTEWNMRLTTTGEFLHAAPWSQWAQGSRNVSHGCTNMSMANADWMFQNSMIGDPVEFVGSDRKFVDGEGITAWQYSWADWLKKSATPR